MCRFAHVRVKSNRGENEWQQFFLMRNWKYYYDVGKIYQFIISYCFLLGEININNINKHVWTTIVTLDKRKNKIKHQYYSFWEPFNPKHCSFPDLFFPPFVIECVISLSIADHALESTTCLLKKIVTRRDEGYITNMFKQ